ncbi:MAG: DUF5671 domain-containing protein [Patescibacteria group bacterium]
MNETTKTTPKDFFLHLSATLALYVSAGALINLLFSVINYHFPDQLAGYFYANAVAWPISLLVILVPTLYVLEYLINRDITKMPEKGNLLIRKWRIYLTLFLTAVLIGGDLIALINVYLNGEISARFVWKVVAVLVVGGAVGKYYFFSLYTQFKKSKLALAVIPWFGIVLVLAAIVAGFITVGSPQKQRDMRFDSQRVADLQNIQWQIINYWQTKEKLPATLDDLKDPLSGAVIPLDPEKQVAYGYSIKGPLTFSLCADFARESLDTKGRGEFYGRGGGIGYPMPMYDTSIGYPGISGDENWQHAAETTCFDRTIDPDKYAPIKPDSAVIR